MGVGKGNGGGGGDGDFGYVFYIHMLPSVVSRLLFSHCSEGSVSCESVDWNLELSPVFHPFGSLSSLHFRVNCKYSS